MEVLTPQALRSRRGYRWFGLGPLLSGVPHPFPSVPPLMTMSVAASEGEPLSPGMTLGCVAPFGVVALSEPDPEMTAMLSRAAENVGLVWNPPPRPDPSRLDEWFLGGGSRWFSAPPSGAILSGSA